MSRPTDWSDYVTFARHLADEAAKVILPHFRQPIPVEEKQGLMDFDPVTHADRVGEAAMRALINMRFPDHGIIGEEYGTEREGADFVWTLDPIDGTRAFIAGLPSWTTLISLMQEGQPVLGLIAQPHMGEQFIGSPAGSFLGKRKLQVRACTDFSQAIATTTGVSWFTEEQRRRIQGFLDGPKLVRFGFDAYGYAILSMGFIDCIAEAGLSLWDYAALIPVVRNAGGVFTDWSGGEDFSKGEVAVSGDPRTHEQMLAALA